MRPRLLRRVAGHVHQIVTLQCHGAEHYVFGTQDHWGYLEKIGGMRRLNRLRADRLLGY